MLCTAARIHASCLGLASSPETVRATATSRFTYVSLAYL